MDIGFLAVLSSVHFSLEVFKDVHVVGVKTSCFKKRMLVFPEIFRKDHC